MPPLARQLRLATRLKLAAAAGALVPVYYRAVLPRLNHWGVTEAEKRRPLLGDKYVPDPRWQCMRATTIDAPPSEVWKWLVQMGGYRAGWYSHTWAENLFGMGIYNQYELRDEWQPMEPGHKLVYNKRGHIQIVPDVVPEQTLVLHTDSRSQQGGHGSVYYASTGETIELKEIRLFPRGMEAYHHWLSWTFQLDELPGGRTRLLSRTTADWTDHNPILNWVLVNAIETPHTIMEVEMFRRIKACAEGRAHEYTNTKLPRGGEHSADDRTNQRGGSHVVA